MGCVAHSLSGAPVIVASGVGGAGPRLLVLPRDAAGMSVSGALHATAWCDSAQPTEVVLARRPPAAESVYLDARCAARLGRSGPAAMPRLTLRGPAVAVAVGPSMRLFPRVRFFQFSGACSSVPPVFGVLKHAC